MQVQVGEKAYPLVAFLDVYSRDIIHHEILISMDGLSVSTAAQKAVESLLVVLKAKGLGRPRIHPHCLEENGLIERANRTLREALEGEEPSNLLEAGCVMNRIVGPYNQTRLHGALRYPPPVEFHRGDPAAVQGAASETVPGPAPSPRAEPESAQAAEAAGPKPLGVVSGRRSD